MQMNCNNIKTKVFFLLLFISFFMQPPENVYAEKGKPVSVILSMDIGPYRKALEGAASEIKDSFRLYKLSQNNWEEINKTISENSDTEILFAIGSNALLFSMKYFPEKPLIYCMIPDPEKLFDDKKYNYSGVRMETPLPLILKQLKEISAEHKKIGAVIHIDEPLEGFNAIKTQAEGEGFDIVLRMAEDISSAISLFRSMEGEIDAYILSSDSDIYTDLFFKYIYSSSIKNRFILVGSSSLFTEKGSLFSLSGNNYDWGKQAGKMIKVMLGSDKKERLPARYAEHFDLSINLDTAKKLEIKIPLKVLNSATQIIKN